MPRFFVKNNQINNDKITIIDEDVKHIKNVLRKQIGDKIEVCNQDTGNSYKCEIEIIAENEIETKIIEEQKNIREKIKVDIYQGLPKSDKMELIIQKSVELGANSIIPVNMKRCVVKLEGKDEIKKNERWQKIAESAAKQCGRGFIPEVKHLINVKEICNWINEYDVIIVAYENEKEKKKKYELKRNIDKLFISINSKNKWKLNNFITECPYVKGKYIIDTKYDKEIGLLLELDEGYSIDSREL